MSDRRTVLCAVDLGPLTPRVLFHAAGMARLLSAELKIVHVAGDASAAVHEHVLNVCLAQAPYEIALEPEQVLIRTGRVSDAIHRETRRQNAALVVIGSRGRGGLTRLVLGSTSAAVLKGAAAPLLIVPPSDMDIVSIGDHARLTCGPVLAAVDLGASCGHQLRVAAEMAALASQPLMLMTVAKSRTSDHDAALELRDRARSRVPAQPHAVIVRRGPVAQEIVNCARTEHAGLVVMGVSHGRPGAIAAAILRTGRAFVLAVPAGPTPQEELFAHSRAMAPLASLMLVLALATGSAAQVRFSDEAAIVRFQRAADAYAFLHRQVERRLGMDHRGVPESDAMARAMREARPRAVPGELLTPDVTATLRLALARAAHAPGCGPPHLSGAVPQVHDSARDTQPVPPCLLEALPHLPVELEFRAAGDALVLVDTHAGLVVDLVSGLFSTTMSDELDDHRQHRHDDDADRHQ